MGETKIPFSKVNCIIYINLFKCLILISSPPDTISNSELGTGSESIKKYES